MMAVSLPSESRQALADAIQVYVRDDWDVEIGSLRAGLFVEFLLETAGPPVYNRAIQDAQVHIVRIAEELDLTLHEPEADL